MMAFGLMLAATVAAYPAPDSSARALSLKEAVALAERNATQVIQALGQRRTSAAGVRSAYAAFLPSLSLSAGSARQVPSTGGRTRIDENGRLVTLPDQPWSYSAGFGATLQLFSGGRRIFELQQARAQEKAAAGNEVAQRYSATLAVKQQFFNVLAARESEAAARAQLEQAEQQLKASIARVRAKNATRSDSLRATIQVSAAGLALMQARISLAGANASLGRAVGIAEAVTASDADTLVSSELGADDATLLQMAEAGPAVTQAIAELAAARAAKRGAWSGYLPSLSASYSRSGNGVGDDLLPTSDALGYTGSLRFSASFPIFNQLQREEQVTGADVAEENAVAGLRDARLAAREALVQSLGAFRSAAERITSQRATLEAALEDLRMQQQRYDLGSSTLLDVLTSQTTLDQARSDLIRARYDQHIAKAQLEALVGRDL